MVNVLEREIKCTYFQRSEGKNTNLGNLLATHRWVAALLSDEDRAVARAHLKEYRYDFGGKKK